MELGVHLQTSQSGNDIAFAWCWIHLRDIHFARQCTSWNFALAPAIEAVAPQPVCHRLHHKSFPPSRVTGWSGAYVWWHSPCSAPCGSCSSPTPATPAAPPLPGKQQSKNSQRACKQKQTCACYGGRGVVLMGGEGYVGIAEAPRGRLPRQP